jgi:hypothetical protein
MVCFFLGDDHDRALMDCKEPLIFPEAWPRASGMAWPSLKIAANELARLACGWASKAGGYALILGLSLC